MQSYLHQHPSEYEFYQLDKYRIGPLIEEGGYGCIYYAQDENHQRYALKIISLHELQPHSLKHQEKAMHHISSKFVVQSHQAYTHATLTHKYIVMQLCGYFNLWNIIFFKGNLPPLQSLIYLRNIVSGLVSIYNSGYMHRDLKPTNICFCGDRCVIIDLGCTRKLGRNGNGAINFDRPTKGTVIGSGSNMSPEMLRGEMYTYKTDLWGLGVLYYQMVVGVGPFRVNDGESDDAILTQIQAQIDSIYNSQYISQRVKQEYEDRLRPQEIKSFQIRAGKSIPPDTKAFLQKLIAIDPHKRFTWAQLEQEKYLWGDIDLGVEDNIWKLADCVLPLADAFVHKHQQKEDPMQMDKQGKGKKRNGKAEEEEEQMGIVEGELQKCGEQDIHNLKNNYESFVKEEKEKYNNSRIFHFQVRKIKLLMDLHRKIRTKLKQTKQATIFLFLYKISSYCLEIVKKMMEHVKNNGDVGIYTHKNQMKFRGVPNLFLYYYIEKICATDANLCKEQIDATQEVGDNFYKSFYDNYKKVIEFESDQSKFLKESKYFLEFEYKPKDNLIWQKWGSFTQIIQYNKKYTKKVSTLH